MAMMKRDSQTSAIEKILGYGIPYRIYTDSLSLFDSLTTLNTTSEKLLLIDLSMYVKATRNERLPMFYKYRHT